MRAEKNEQRRRISATDRCDTLPATIGPAFFLLSAFCLSLALKNVLFGTHLQLPSFESLPSFLPSFLPSLPSFSSFLLFLPPPPHLSSEKNENKNPKHQIYSIELSLIESRLDLLDICVCILNTFSNRCLFSIKAQTYFSSSHTHTHTNKNNNTDKKKEREEKKKKTTTYRLWKSLNFDLVMI